METKINLDEIDKKLLFHLDTNSRESLTKIGKDLRISKERVKFRIERLVRKDIIKSFGTTWNITMLGYSQYTIYIRFKKSNLEKEKRFIDEIKQNQYVNWIVKVDGQYDLVFAIHIKTIQDFYNFFQKLIFEYSDIIHKKDIMSIISLYQFKRYYLCKSKKPEKIDVANWVIKTDEIKIDETDKIILNMLSENSREPATKIAKKANITPEAVNNRIKKMLKNNLIQSFMLKINWKNLGINSYKVILYFKQLTEKRKNDLIQFCSLHPNTIYLIEGIGVGDMHIDLEIEGRKEFHNFLLRLRELFSDIIADYEILTITDEIKIQYKIPD